MSLPRKRFRSSDHTGVPIPASYWKTDYADRSLITLAREEAEATIDIRLSELHAKNKQNRREIEALPKRRHLYEALANGNLDSLDIPTKISTLIYTDYWDAFNTSLEYGLRHAVWEALHTRPKLHHATKLESVELAFQETHGKGLVCPLCDKAIAVTSAQELEQALSFKGTFAPHKRGAMKLFGPKTPIPEGPHQGKMIYDHDHPKRSIIAEPIEYDHMGPAAHPKRARDTLKLNHNYRWESLQDSMKPQALLDARYRLQENPSLTWRLLTTTILESYSPEKERLFNMPEHIRPVHPACNEKDSKTAHKMLSDRSQQEWERIWNPSRTAWGLQAA